MTATQNTKGFTANQTAILNAITAGAGTDAEIGETFDAKLSTIATVARSLIKRGVLYRMETGRYALVAEVEANESQAEAGEVAPDVEDMVDAGIPVDEPEVAETDEPTLLLDITADETKEAGTAAASVAKAVELQSAGKPFMVTPSGKWAKTVTVGRSTYVTIDGKHLIVKNGTGKKDAWTVFEVVVGKKATRLNVVRDDFRTCETAFVALADGNGSIAA